MVLQAAFDVKYTHMLPNTVRLQNTATTLVVGAVAT